MAVSVLFIGFAPEAIDFTEPAYAQAGGDAAKIRAGIDRSIGALRQGGYEAAFLGLPADGSAEAVLRQRLATGKVDCVVIGAGIRLFPKQTALLEKLVNAVVQDAPGARIAFNTNPGDTAEAVQRWFPTAG